MERAGRWIGGCEIEEDVVRREVVAVVDAGDVMEVRMDKKRGSIAAISGLARDDGFCLLARGEDTHM